MFIDKGPCRTCGEEYEITYTAGGPIVQGECTKCYMDRSRGRKHCESTARRLAIRARRAKAEGDMDRARNYAIDARRLVALTKVCHG